MNLESKSSRLITRCNPRCLRICGETLLLLTISLSLLVCSTPAIAQNTGFGCGVSSISVDDYESSHPKMGKELFALRDTFWSLKRLDGSTANLSDALVGIVTTVRNSNGESGLVIFSTFSYSFTFPYSFNLSQLKFSSANGNKFTPAERVAQLFADDLAKVCGYELRNGSLALIEKGRHPLIVLGAIDHSGIEDHHWRIAKYSSEEEGPERKLIDATTPADVVFVNGRIYGSPGCGGWTGKYHLSDETLTSSIDLNLSLGGLCSQKQAEQAARVKKALNGDTRIEKVGGNIFLRNMDGGAEILLAPF